ncbi:MAG: hypothetical protein K2Q45_01505 [Nitrosomonas sp.]|nr:hypothetical protein [Nitrosomonas sp.]
MKMQGCLKIPINQLSLFIKLREQIYSDTMNYCGDWSRWFVVTFDVPIPFKTGFHFNFVNILESIVYEQIYLDAYIAIDKANFTFLCCISKLFCKDIRRLLFEYVDEGQTELWNKNGVELEKFKKRYCKREFDD